MVKSKMVKSRIKAKNKTGFVRDAKFIIQMGIILMYLASFFATRAFIYDIHIMRKWDETNKKYCYFIGLGDFHDKNHSITDLQAKQIDQMVARCKKDKTKLIVEDICSEPSNGVKFSGKFCINSTGGLLGGIADKYRKECANLASNGNNMASNSNNLANKGNNLAGDNFVDNIEYRFCRVASLAPVINNVSADCNSFQSTAKIRIKSFKEEIMSVVGEISKFNDGEVLKKLYKNAIDSALACMAYLKFDGQLDLSVADYINLNSVLLGQKGENQAGQGKNSISQAYSVQEQNDKNKLSFVKKLLIFDSALVDSKIIHSIAGDGQNIALNNSGAKNVGANIGSKQNFIVIAGGSHIRNVSLALQSIGYKTIYESDLKANVATSKGSGAEVTATSSACASSSTSVGETCRPEPADLSVLDKFI